MNPVVDQWGKALRPVPFCLFLPSYVSPLPLITNLFFLMRHLSAMWGMDGNSVHFLVFIFMRAIVKASSTAGSLSTLLFCLVSTSPGPSMYPQPSKASGPLLRALSHPPAAQGWHSGIPGLPFSCLSYSGENLACHQWQ